MEHQQRRHHHHQYSKWSPHERNSCWKHKWNVTDQIDCSITLDDCKTRDSKTGGHCAMMIGRSQTPEAGSLTNLQLAQLTLSI
jgi:hypothetical protein